MAAVKGTAWLTLKSFLSERSGADAMARVLARLGPSDAEALRRNSLPGSWGDYGADTRVLLAADDVLGRGDRTLIRDSAVHHARKDMRGIYRMFIRVATPGFVIGRAAKLWRLIIDSGELRVVRQTPKGVDLELTNIEGVPPHHELDQLPFMEEIARMTGAKNVQATHPKCLARGDDRCVYIVRWE